MSVLPIVDEGIKQVSQLLNFNSKVGQFLICLVRQVCLADVRMPLTSVQKKVVEFMQ